MQLIGSSRSQCSTTICAGIKIGPKEIHLLIVVSFLVFAVHGSVFPADYMNTSSSSCGGTDAPVGGDIIEKFSNVYVYEDMQAIAADDSIDTVSKCEQYCLGTEGCLSYYFGTSDPCGSAEVLNTPWCLLSPRHQMPPQDPTSFIYTVAMHNHTKGSLFGTKRNGKLEIASNAVTWYHSVKMLDNMIL